MVSINKTSNIYQIAQWLGHFGWKLLDNVPIKLRPINFTEIIRIEIRIDWVKDNT
jgi:hypothetical protein